MVIYLIWPSPFRPATVNTDTYTHTLTVHIHTHTHYNKPYYSRTTTKIIKINNIITALIDNLRLVEAD